MSAAAPVGWAELVARVQTGQLSAPEREQLAELVAAAAAAGAQAPPTRRTGSWERVALVTGRAAWLVIAGLAAVMTAISAGWVPWW